MTQRLEFNLLFWRDYITESVPCLFFFLTIIFIFLLIPNDIPKDKELINFALTCISFESLTPLLEAENENKRKLL